MAVAELEMALDKEEIQALWAAEHSTSTVGFSTSTSTGLGRGIESATSRRKPGEASRGDGEVSEKSYGKQITVPVGSIPKAHTWLPDGALASAQ